MPKPPNGGFFLVSPGKVAILAVKFLWNNFERAKHADERRRQKFPGHLRIFDI